uniref:Si:ch211-196f5.2 n=1 Tax=Mastacembelus armatus TaxID=205130 RepID=A0A3Q3NIJ4_9TELE
PEEGEANVEQASRGPESPAGGDSHGRVVRVELERDIPMLVTVPIKVQPDPTHQPFPFLDTTLADLGIQESEVKERVVWVDTKKTQVKSLTFLFTEAHTDRSFCRTGMTITPWKHTCAGDNGLEPVEMRRALDMKNQQPDFTEAQRPQEI